MVKTSYRALLGVLAVTVVCLFVAGMIGQDNDGPWGGLPEWLGAVTWFGFLVSALVLIALSASLLVAHLRSRRQHGRAV